MSKDIWREASRVILRYHCCYLIITVAVGCSSFKFCSLHVHLNFHQQHAFSSNALKRRDDCGRRVRISSSAYNLLLDNSSFEMLRALYKHDTSIVQTCGFSPWFAAKQENFRICRRSLRRLNDLTLNIIQREQLILIDFARGSSRWLGRFVLAEAITQIRTLHTKANPNSRSRPC